MQNWDFRTLPDINLGETTQQELEECGTVPSVELLFRMVRERSLPDDAVCRSHGYTKAVDSDMFGLNCKLNVVAVKTAEARKENLENNYRRTGNPAFSLTVDYDKSIKNQGYNEPFENFNKVTSNIRETPKDFANTLTKEECDLVMNPAYTEYGAALITTQPGGTEGNRYTFHEAIFGL